MPQRTGDALMMPRYACIQGAPSGRYPALLTNEVKGGPMRTNQCTSRYTARMHGLTRKRMGSSGIFKSFRYEDFTFTHSLIAFINREQYVRAVSPERETGDDMMIGNSPIRKERKPNPERVNKDLMKDLLSRRK